MNELLIEAKTENVDTVLNFINKHIGECPPKISNQIGIAVDEVLSNIIRYAYHPDTGSVLARIIVNNVITIEFEDGGMAYDPFSSDDPDFTLSAEERDIGGLGIFILKNIMDSVKYRREGNKNILTIQKALK